ncbi:MAG: Rieske (2Fe-2S) protein, partial [Lentisphaeria bacterium]|nr:Rieske (2Fe-2S) protein [Lentisphaeria bacterium]
LLPTLLGDEPLAIIAALEDALIAGATPLQLARVVCYAAGLRLARFGLSNEVGDWFGPQHAFITANAMHGILQRCTTPDIARGVFHSAVTVYMDRFLNVPPAALPGEAGGLDHLSTDANELLAAMLDALDRKDQTELLAELVSRYVELGHPFDALVDRLMYATVREDVNFHYFQVLEAAVSQVADQPHTPQSAHILVGIARNLSAICPTARASLQLITVAARLSKGERVHEG